MNNGKLKVASAMDTTDKVFYWAVACGRCGIMLPQARISFDDKARAIRTIPERFQVHCTTCGDDAEYREDQVQVWMGPRTIAEFHPHPAFR